MHREILKAPPVSNVQLVARTLWGTKGIASRSKKLLVAPGIISRNKKLLVARALTRWRPSLLVTRS